MNYKNLAILIMLAIVTSCGSAKFVPTTDKCSLEKHWKEAIYQVRINDEKINTHWYLKKDAKEIMKSLASKNKCMSQDITE
ncbi:hypothetical protein [Halobacteriovorax sp. HLS]|uniref:hypothetical protein n=1 Tax=Halobacteriovorax sp. HLS TaxID=2234000 RepID=UPI000FDC8466|nr:hypothetical protein [Halobacteriovorax sp. HLS]